MLEIPIRFSREQLRSIHGARITADALVERIALANQEAEPGDIEVDPDVLDQVVEGYLFLYNALASTGRLDTRTHWEGHDGP